MRAMYINASGQVEFGDINKLVRQEGEVLLKSLYGGICGNDLDSYKGTLVHFDYPKIPGHELSAEIVEVDEGNGRGLRPRMIVTCNLYFNYGYCYSCEHGIADVCMDNQTMGCQRGGAFQEYIVMPKEHVYDGKGLGPMLFATIEPFCISYHGAGRVEVKPGNKVLAIGAGTIDVLAVMTIKVKGAVVYISDVSMGKPDMAREFGVDGIILNDPPEGFDKAVREITDGSGSDIAVETAGLPSAFQNCTDATCFGGRMVVTGVGKKNLGFNFTLLQKKEFNVFGSRSALKKDFVGLVDLVKEGKVLIKGIITNIYKFEDGAKASNDFTNNPGNCPLHTSPSPRDS